MISPRPTCLSLNRSFNCTRTNITTLINSLHQLENHSLLLLLHKWLQLTPLHNCCMINTIPIDKKFLLLQRRSFSQVPTRLESSLLLHIWANLLWQSRTSSAAIARFVHTPEAGEKMVQLLLDFDPKMSSLLPHLSPTKFWYAICHVTLLSCVVINCAIWSTDHKVVINLSWVELSWVTGYTVDASANSFLCD